MRINNRSLFQHRIHAQIAGKKDDESTLYIYDEISWWGINAEDFVKALNEIKSSTIHIRLNSPGGDVFDGTSIVNAIRQHKSKVVAHVDGLAASMASVIAISADEVVMSENAFLMIHDPWSMVAGNAAELRKYADLLDKVGDNIAKTYMDKSGKDREEVLALMAAETWFTAEEALEAGLIDRIDKDENEKAKASFDLSIFANVPDALKESKALPTAKAAEKALRDVGFSHKQAKSILSGGLPDDLRDVDHPEKAPAPVREPRDVVPEAPRDVVQPVKAKRDRVADLLIRAEIAAPAH